MTEPPADRLYLPNSRSCYVCGTLNQLGLQRRFYLADESAVEAEFVRGTGLDRHRLIDPSHSIGVGGPLALGADLYQLGMRTVVHNRWPSVVMEARRHGAAVVELVPAVCNAIHVESSLEIAISDQIVCRTSDRGKDEEAYDQSQ